MIKEISKVRSLPLQCLLYLHQRVPQFFHLTLCLESTSIMSDHTSWLKLKTLKILLSNTSIHNNNSLCSVTDMSCCASLHNPKYPAEALQNTWVKSQAWRLRHSSITHYQDHLTENKKLLKHMRVHVNTYNYRILKSSLLGKLLTLMLDTGQSFLANLNAK